MRYLNILKIVYFVLIVKTFTIVLKLLKRAVCIMIYLLSSEALLVKKLQPNLDNQLGPDKGSRVTINIFK